MSESAYVYPLIFSLMNDGKDLADLLQEANDLHKQKPNPPNDCINPEKVHKTIGKLTNLLKELENPKLPSSCPETVILKVLEKIQTTLQKLIKFDPKNAESYEGPAKKVEESIKKQSSQMGSKDLLSQVQNDDRPSVTTDQESDTNKPVVQLENLNELEKKCLACFCLFPEKAQVNKREPIHLWISLSLVENTIEGAEMLCNLVSKGFVERTIGNKKLRNRYKINASVDRLQLCQETRTKVEEQRKHFCIMTQEEQARKNLPRQLSRVPSLVPYKETQGGVDLVLNRSEDILHARTLDRLVIRKNSIKVLHLGGWDHDHKRYIMVEEMDALKAIMKSMGQLTFLSLQGISGVVELPEIVYRLENLKILDLKACPNLESLPEGIESLRKLTHLDLSECYLLGYIPDGISSLTELEVLKGFVINPEDPGEVTENEKEIHNTTRSSASFRELSNLTKLIKLTIRTRRTTFPTSEDLDVLSKMDKLVSLSIAWVWSSIDSPNAGASGRFPASLRKVELQAAPENTLSRILMLISEDSNNCLEKLYIRGGRLWDFGVEMRYFAHVHTIRLRYLPELRIDWDQFKKLFPKLTRLEVSCCPNIIFFPFDDNGVWEETYIGYSS